MKTASFIVTFILALSTTAGMGEQYAQGQSFGPIAGVPTMTVSAQNLEGVQVPQDKAHEVEGLKKINETALSEKGKAAGLASGSFGIADAHNKMVVNAIHKHKIKPEAALFQAANAYEQATLTQMGGSVKTSKKKITKESKETCAEGVTFEIDILRQLYFIPPYREDLNTTLTLYYPDYVYNVGIQNDVMAYLPVGLRDHQVDIEKFRKFGCPHFKPVDAITGKAYKIDCKRIRNFYAVRVSDASRGYRHVDRFGQRIDPVKHILINYQHDTFQSDEGGKEYWYSVTPENEKFADEESCVETNRVCLEHGDKHFDELVVHRPCWKEKITLQCKTEPQNGCQHLMKKGCNQERSECVVQRRGLCLKWRRDYTCKTTEEVIVKEISAPLFCLDGDCFKPDLKDNTGMNEAVAYLQLLKEMTSDIKAKNIQIFKGENDNCAMHLTNFTNCCTALSGWGTSVGLSKCSGDEKALAQKRDKKLCHYVGTHCAEKFLGVCIRKKSAYCCFPSKIARVFHEEGRPQIGKGWGDSKHPRCEGFTREELVKLDFSKMNLSELIQDFVGKADKTATKEFPKQLVNTMPTMQGVASKPKEGEAHVF